MQKMIKNRGDHQDALFLTIDVGTTGCKAIVFDSCGRIYGQGYKEYGVKHPADGWAEQDPDDWWEAVIQTARQACSNPGVRKRVVTISVSSQREGVVPVDENGNALSSCIIWLDTRTEAQAKQIAAAIAPGKITNITGLAVNPVFSAAKILWIRQNQPEIYRKTFKFLQTEDYILLRLSGRFVSEDSIASRTMLFDIRRRSWSEELLEALRIPATLLPETVKPGQVVGELRPEAAEALGLPGEVKVVAAGGDQQTSLVGVGAINPGRATVSLGTSTSVCVTVDAPVIEPQGRISCCCGAVSGKWDLEAPIWTTGVLLRWFRDTFGHVEKAAGDMLGVDPYDLIVEEAAKSPPGAKGLTVLPHFSGAGAPHWNPVARGVLYGLRLDHSRSDMIRAIMEGVSCNIQEVLETIDFLGVSVNEIVVIGGGARSKFWRQMIADVTGKKVLVPNNTEAVLLGSAALSATAFGVYDALESATESMIPTFEAVEANPAQSRLYQDILAQYKRVYRQMFPA